MPIINNGENITSQKGVLIVKKTSFIILLIFTLILPSIADAKGFRGGSSRGSTFSHSNSSISSKSGSTYRSGYKSPSSNATKKPSYNNQQNYNNNQQRSSKTKSILTHGAAFGAGALLGSMLHPFGGGGYYGGYGGGGFSILPILIDIVVILIIIRIIKSIFSRRRY